MQATTTRRTDHHFHSQKECEESCLAYLKEGEQEINMAKGNGESCSLLLREKHLRYCRRGLEKLGRGFTALDASKPWLMYGCYTAYLCLMESCQIV